MGGATLKPSFAVVICNYNYGHFVGDAICSALNQTYPPHLVHVVVVDDGSNDDSKCVYAQFASVPRVTVVHQENRGQAAAFDTGVRASRGKYVCLLDSDDLFLPDKLARVADHIAQLDVPADELFLCHDLHLDDIGNAEAVPPTQATRLAKRWFDLVGVVHLPNQWRLNDVAMHFPFAIPCGQVFSMQLLLRCHAALPAWDARQGADGILCPAALILAGCVHYLKEPLGVYRIHARNEFASVVGGQYVARFDPGTRTARTLQHLHRWIDALALVPAHRRAALDYIKRMERLCCRLSNERALGAPKVDVVRLSVDSSRSELVQMAGACMGQTGEYVVFLKEGEELDSDFVARHLHWHQFAALVGVTCSNVQVHDSLPRAGEPVVHDGGLVSAHPRQRPPLAMTLAGLPLPARAGCLFRRTRILDLLFAQAESLPLPLQNAGFWLALELQQQTLGALLIPETLSHSGGQPALPCNDALEKGAGQHLAKLAAHWLHSFYMAERSVFQAWLPPAWHEKFLHWIWHQGESGSALGSDSFLLQNK